MSATGVVLRVRRGARVALTALVAGALLTACAAESAPPKPPVTSTPAPEPTAEAWARFGDPRTPGSFEVPSGWSVVESDESEPEHEIFRFDLLDESGTTQLRFARKVMGLGGGCADLAQQFTELEVLPIEVPGYVAATGDYAPSIAPSFTFTVLQDADDPGLHGTLGIRDSEPVTDCFYYNLVRTETALVSFADTLKVTAYDAPRHFATIAEARAYMDTEQYATLKRVLLSFRLDG
ncbi:hypothetical protein [Leucobacter sp. G161]|uniref:hypothetical protein n=1 Tax=Leucobacter sp. G161 TaxID=663704 RepID=UPI00128FB1EA|nr:hypothetical protein [Leucobacter sp. G161]